MNAFTPASVNAPERCEGKVNILKDDGFLIKFLLLPIFFLFITLFYSKNFSMKQAGIIIAILLGYIIYKKVIMVEKLAYKIDGFRFDGQRVILTLALINNTDTTTDVQSIHLSIFANGQLIGNVDKTDLFKISAGTTLVDMPLQIQVPELFTTVINYISSHTMSFDISGTITADFIPVPVNTSYNV